MNNITTNSSLNLSPHNSKKKKIGSLGLIIHVCLLIDKYNDLGDIKLIQLFKAALSNSVATSRMWLFKFKLVNIN